jgi:predicted acyltransferase
MSESISASVAATPLYIQWVPVVVGLGVVSAVFLLTLLVVFLLRSIGGRPSANVTATVKRFGGNLVISSGGAVGGFLAIAVTALIALWFVAKLIRG